MLSKYTANPSIASVKRDVFKMVRLWKINECGEQVVSLSHGI